MRKVKIVCTLGPSTAGASRMAELVAAAMDVARLNMSHGDREFHCMGDVGGGPTR